MHPTSLSLSLSKSSIIRRFTRAVKPPNYSPLRSDRSTAQPSQRPNQLILSRDFKSSPRTPTSRENLSVVIGFGAGRMRAGVRWRRDGEIRGDACQCMLETRWRDPATIVIIIVTLFPIRRTSN
ncbi:hypothetical protein ACFE04_021118 [Oxalis oulophora]